jgi:uncharacterized phage protein (TIGR02218 family)
MPLTESEIEALKAFHVARNGKTEGFWVKVPDNHVLTSAQGNLLPLGDTDTLFQIIRIHAVGTAQTHKPIRRVVSDTTRVFIDGIESLSGWTVNLNTGEVLFDDPQTGVLTVSCEFYTPMRFDNDSIEGIQVSGGEDDVFRFIQNPPKALEILRELVGSLNPIYQVSGLTLKEVHIPIGKTFYNLTDFTALTTDFSYPIVPQNVKTTEKRVELEDSTSGVESTELRDTRTITRYLSTALRNDEIDYPLNYFLVAKGRAIAFNGKRFDSDDFSYTRVSPDYSIVSDITVISCPDGSRRYHVFGRYLSKHTTEFNQNQGDPRCNKISNFRTVAPITLTPFENTSVIEVTRSNRENIPDVESNLIVKKKYQSDNQGIDLWQLDDTGGFTAGAYINYEKKALIPENVIGGSFGVSIGYRAKNLSCNGGGETPSFPRGDDPEITDIVEITNGAVGGSLPFATILKITRQDGEIRAYTSWDSDLMVDSILYLSNAGIIPTAVASKSDMSADNLEVSTFFNDITEVDILSGKYENAQVEAWVVNIADLEKDPISLFGGEVGEITSGDTRFTFALRSKSTRLNQAISVRTSDQCNYKFCDAKCLLNIEDYTVDGFEVTELFESKYSQRQFKVSPQPSENDFDFGYLEFTSGQLEGVRLDVRNVTPNSNIVLWSNPPLGLAVGDTLKLVRGCAKTPTACQVYNNYVNFGGFPVGGNWMIGDDALLSGD